LDNGKTNSIVYNSDTAKVSLFFKQFAKLKTVCSVHIKVKHHGKHKLEAKARRNSSEDKWIESIGIELSGKRAVEKLKKLAFEIEDKASVHFERYTGLMNISRDFLKAADSLESDMTKTLKASKLVSRDETPENTGGAVHIKVKNHSN
jgi:hypothetical protein